MCTSAAIAGDHAGSPRHPAVRPHGHPHTDTARRVSTECRPSFPYPEFSFELNVSFHGNVYYTGPMRTRSFLLLILILTLLSGVAAGAAVAAGRSSAAGDSCFRVMEGETILLDATLGVAIPDRRDGGGASVFFFPPSVSPDNAYMLSQGLNEDGSLTLGIRPNTSSEGAPPTWTRLLDSAQTIEPPRWSPDGKWLLLLWIDGGGARMLTVARVDGSAVATKPLTVSAYASSTFEGWSADGRYVATSAVNYNAAPQVFITLWRLDDLHPTRTVVVEAQNYQVWWSPVGHRLAVITTVQFGTLKGLIASASEVRDLPLDLPAGGFGEALWSPDGTHLLVNYSDTALNQQLIVYRVEEEQAVPFRRIQRGDRILFLGSGAWSPDGSHLIYWAQAADNDYERTMNALDLRTGETTILLENIDFNSQSLDPLRATGTDPKRRIAVTYRDPKRGLAIDLMNLDGTDRVPLVSDARAIDVIDWSDDYEIVLVKWRGVDGARIVHRLTWAYAHGGEPIILEDTNLTLRDLRLVAAPELGEELVIAIGEVDGRFRVELIALISNQRVTLAQDLTSVNTLQIDAKTGHISFWWRRAESTGFDRFAFNGQRIASYSVPRRSEVAEIRLSPDARYALLRTISGQAAQLWLTPGDGGEANLLMPEASTTNRNFGVWAADSQRFAVESYVNNSSAVVDLYHADGRFIRRWERTDTNVYGSVLAWTNCR